MSQSVSGSAIVRSNQPDKLVLLLTITDGKLPISITPNSDPGPNTGTCDLSSMAANLHVSRGEFDQLEQRCPRGVFVEVSINYETYDGTNNNVNAFVCAGMTITFSLSASAAA